MSSEFSAWCARQHRQHGRCDGQGHCAAVQEGVPGQLTKPCWIVNFPTKGHWRSRSRISDLEAGLDDLRAVIAELKITSIALPPLGCGNGGLDWADARPLIEDKLQGLEAEVHIYAPADAPAAADMRVVTPRRKCSPGSPRPTSRSPFGQPLGNQAVGFTIRQCVALAGPRVNEWAGGSECAADGCEIVGVPRQYVFLEAHGQHDEMCVHDIGRSRSSQQSANCWTVVECVNRHMLEEGS